MSATKASRQDLGITKSLTQFFDLQPGQKTARQLYEPIIEWVFSKHHVIWVEADVKSVLRAANNRGSAIEHETALDEARTQRYREAQLYIAQHSSTRTRKRQATAERQPVIDEYNRIVKHTHMPLSLAQVEMHRAMRRLDERALKIKADNEAEEKRIQEAIRQRNRDEAAARREQRAKKTADTAEKKREEAAAKAAKEAQTTRAINTQMAKALVEHNKDRYKRKREDGELRTQFMQSGLLVMNKFLAELTAEGQKEQEQTGSEDENKENVEHSMPI